MPGGNFPSCHAGKVFLTFTLMVLIIHIAAAQSNISQTNGDIPGTHAVSQPGFFNGLIHWLWSILGQSSGETSPGPATDSAIANNASRNPATTPPAPGLRTGCIPPVCQPGQVARCSENCENWCGYRCVQVPDRTPTPPLVTTTQPLAPLPTLTTLPPWGTTFPIPTTTPPLTPLPTQTTVTTTPLCTPPVCQQGQVIRCQGNCDNGCGLVCVVETLPVPTPWITPLLTSVQTPACTPLVCPSGREVYCMGNCDNGCGYICLVTTEPVPVTTQGPSPPAPTPTPFPVPRCTPLVCPPGHVLQCPGTCDYGCGYVCVVPTTPTPIPVPIPTTFVPTTTPG